MKPTRSLLSFLFGSVFLTAQMAQAATYYWDTNGNLVTATPATGTWGTDDFWSTDSTGATATSAQTIDNTSDLFFSAAANSTGGTVTINGTQSAHSITFDDATGGITLSGGTAINLGSATAGSGLFFTSATGSANTISTGIILNSAATDIAISNSGTALQTIGDITGSAAGLQTITVGSSNTGGITIGGIIGNGGGGGNVGITVNSAGAGVTTLSGANTYSGDTTLTAGTLQGLVVGTSLTPTSPFGTSALQLNGGTLQLRASGTLNTTAETIVLGNNTIVGGNTTINVNRPGATSTTKTIQLGTLSIGANTLNVTGGNTYGVSFGATTLTGNAIFNPTTGNLTLGAVGDGGAGYSITKNGAGTLTLNGNHTFGGNVTVSAGTLTLNGTSSSAGNVVVNGGTFNPVGINSFVDITINGATLTSGGTSVGPGTLGARGGTITFTGTSSYNPQRSITGNYDKNVNIASGTTTFNQSTQYYHETFTGVLSGAGNIIKNDSNGILTFSNAANTFTGAIRLDGGAGGMVVNSLADSANAITFNGTTGGLTLGAGAASPLLFNSRQIVLANTAVSPINNNNASNSNTITINTNLGFSGAGTRSLSLGGTNLGLNTFDGNITNNGGSATAVTKSGGGRWLISGDMSHTGGITFSGGTLVLSGTNTYSGATNFNAAGIQLIFAGTQAVSPNTTYVMNTNASTSDSSVKLLDDTGGVNGSLVTATGSTFRIQNNNGPGNAHTFIVGNNNTANGGTSSGTTTGSTIAIGTLDWNTYASGTTAYGPINIQGTNGYRLQIGSVVLHNAANLTSGTVGQTTFNPTTANVTLGTVTVGTGNVALGYQTLVLDGTSSDNRVTGAISDASDVGTSLRPLRVTKSNSSTWTLQGTNTYTGITAVSGGKLFINGDSSGATGNVSVTGGSLGGNGGSLGGAVTVSSAGGLDLRDTAGVGTLTLGSTLDITGAAGANNLYFDLGNNTGTSDQISVAGTTTVTTTGSAVVNIRQLGGLAGRNATTYTLIGGAGTLDATNFAKFSLATTAAFGQTYALVHDLVSDGGTGNLQLTTTNVTSATPAAFWAGGGNNWSTTTNWRASLAADDAVAGAPDYQTNVTYSTTTPVAANLTTNVLDVDFDINSLTFTNASGNVTIGGTKMLTIEAAAVNGNTLGNGINSLKTTGTNTISAKVGLASSQTWTVASGGTLAVTGVISDFGGGYGITKAGAGTLTLSANPTYTGATIVNGGTLDVSGISGNPLSSSSGLTFTGTSTFTYLAANINLPSTTISPGATANFRNSSSGSIFTFTIPSLSGSGTFSGDNPGGTGQNKIIAFTDLSNFTGVLQMNTSGASFIYQLSNLNDTVASNIRFTGNAQSLANPNRLRYVGSAGLTLTNRAIELAHTSTGFVAIDNNGTNNSSLIINSNLAVTTAGAKTLTLGGNNTGGTSTFAGTINDGTSAVISLNKADANTWSLTNTSNGFTGAISVNAGTLAYASAGGANGITFSNTTGVATLTYTGSTDKTMSGAITASTVTSGTVTLGSTGAGAVNYSNTASLGSTGTLVKNLVLSGTNTGDNTLAGAWVNNGTGAATLTKNGVGKWVLSGTNTYTGGTTLNDGALQFAKLVSQPASGAVAVKDGTTLAVNLGGGGEWTTGTSGNGTIGGLLGGLGGQSGGTVTYAGIVTLGFDTTNAGSAQTYSGIIGNVGSTLGITKLGNNTLILDQANTYRGATTVAAGTLEVASTGTVNTSSGITIASGAHFKYNSSTALTRPITNNGGTISGTGAIGVAVAMDSISDVLSPGNSPGVMPFAVGQTWNSLSYDWELNDWVAEVAGTNIDQITVNGTLDLAASSADQYLLNILSLTGGDVSGALANFAESGQSWTILSATSITGFDASEWDINAAGFQNAETGTWSINSTGTDLVLTYTAIPEPGAVFLGSMGLLLILRRRR